jgi:exopolysaccharide biosynthesis polyprenyl glycosylphosphotransferase
VTALSGLTTSQPVLAIPDLPQPSPRNWERLYVGLAVGSDATAAGVAGVLAFLVAYGRDPSGLTAYYLESLVLPVALVLAVAAGGGYERRFMGIGSEEFRRVAMGALALGASAGFLSWATDADIARSYVVVALPVCIVLTAMGRYVLRKWVHGQRRHGRFTSRTVIVGAPSAITDLAEHLQRGAYHGYQVVATMPMTDAEPDLDALARLVQQCEADSVAIVPSHGTAGSTLRNLAWALEPTGANLVVAPTLMDTAGPRLAVRPIDGLPLLHVEHPRFSGVRRLIKSVYDPVAAVAILILIAPVLLAIAVAIKLDSPGPIFFRQERVGKLGRPFKIVKFRTMVLDADRRKQEIAHLNEGSGPLFKARNDPRVTRVGAFLRRTSLDELPQLFNVVSGEMSLVGPRPHLLEEVALFGRDFSRRLFVKPGMTGLWQVSGRSDLTFEESVRLDLRYVENWTLALDLFIIWKTVSVMLNRSGAY